VRHHSRGYVALVERNEAFAALQASQQMLANDLSSAVRYVRSLLPPPLREGAVRADWRFMPSAALGGDSFGYHALDDEHVAFYLLDVCGHGVGAALLSVSALNALRGGALPDADFRDPGSVLAGLNRAFPMERHNDMFFTAWYGVHHLPTRRLRWSGGGHPPAILRGAGRTQFLESDGPLIGAVEGLDYGSSEVEVPPGARLLVYSDGAFEVVRRDGSMWAFEEFVDAVTAAAGGSAGRLDALVAAARRVAGRDDFAADDVSLMEIEFE
jgi:sigma-B regulation protein RsbU (phosphoserine phosphatase)